MAHAVTADPTEAVRLCAAGVHVVLVLPAGAHAPSAAGPGRLAVLVGDPGRPADLAVATEMAAELFGRPGPGPGGTNVDGQATGADVATAPRSPPDGP